MNQKIIDEVAKYYIQSRDFNGLPFIFLLEKFQIDEENLKNLIAQLIKDGVLSISLYINPHIKAFNDPVNDQLDFLKNKSINEIVIYPTKSTLKNRIPNSKFRNKSFSRLLLKGYPIFYTCYFELSVLERYKNDPRYKLIDDGTTLSLSIKDEFYLSKEILEEDKISIRTFSYAYRKDDKHKVVMVYLYYLHNLSSRHQKYWESNPAFGEFLLDSDYIDRSIRGKFTENRTIYEAFLEEVRQINILTELIGKPPLFREEYQHLKDFNNLLRPTAKEFNSFVHLLDKLISENINKDFFKGDIELKDSNSKDTGTIKLLENWLNKYFLPDNPKLVKRIFETFKTIRKLRQKSAHTIDLDEYNNKYFEEQEKIIKDAYIAMRYLRYVFENSPETKINNYKPPDWLQEWKIKF